MLRFALLILFILVNSSLGIYVEVGISDGTIRGITHSTPTGRVFYSFQEIPYAAPPVGNLRFEAPQPPEKWQGVLDTTVNTKMCYQIKLNNSKATEDCLYLNVYTPVDPTTSNDSLPVLVFVHGGAFTAGSAFLESKGPHFFMDYDILVVTVQYRLGAFGFLSTQDDVIPGNNGLKDVLAALKWIQQNIAVFGGDPKKVTLSGQSAGAAVVGYHVISEKSTGLFRAAIMESGAALCSWSYQRYSRKYAYQLANYLDNSFTTNNSSKELLSLLKEVSADEINLAIFPGPTGRQLGQGDIFAPVIEVNHKDAFITDFMYTRLENGDFNQVPTLMGVNSEELIHKADNIDGFTYEMNKLDENITLIINEDYNVDEENLTTVGNIIRAIYTNGTFHRDLGAAIKFSSDVRYTTAVSAQAALQSKFSDVYFYIFGFHGFLAKNYSIEGADNVGHTEEQQYLYRTGFNGNLTIYPERDLLTHNRMLQMWSDFVKYLNPTVEQIELLQNIQWPLVTLSNFSYLNINDTLEIRENPKKYREWKNVIDQYGNPPFDTY